MTNNNRIASWKFTGDIISFVKKTMESHTEYSEGEFRLVADRIRKYASSGDPEDRHLLWMPKSIIGTSLLRERETHLAETSEYIRWTYLYGKGNGVTLAYAIDLDEAENGNAIGTVYELDYRKHAERMMNLGMRVSRHKYVFEDGTTMPITEKSKPLEFLQFVEAYKLERGKNPSFVFLAYPEDELELATILIYERRERTAEKDRKCKEKEKNK